MLENIGNAGNIYLSPHHDDIAFSLGAWVADHPGGVVLNLFTRSDYVAGAAQPRHADAGTIAAVTELRRREDEDFCGRFDLGRLDLGLEEPGLLGRRPFDATRLADDVATLRPRLLAGLDDLLGAGAGRRRLFCPAGIGGHVNHLATRAVVLGDLDRLAGRAEVLFYEELPYAASARVRRSGLADLRLAVGDRRLQRIAWRADAAKLPAINLYASQHRRPVRSLRRFSPAAWWPPGRHEAVWRLLTAS